MSLLIALLVVSLALFSLALVAALAARHDADPWRDDVARGRAARVEQHRAHWRTTRDDPWYAALDPDPFPDERNVA